VSDWKGLRVETFGRIREKARSEVLVSTPASPATRKELSG